MTPTSPGVETRRVPGNQAITGGTIRMTPGGQAQLLNVSATGALVEAKQRLATGTSVVMSIDGDRPQRLQGSVVRSTVTAIHRDSTMTYQLAIAFSPDTKFDGLPEEQPEPEAPSPAPAAVPVEAVSSVVVLQNEW